MDTEEAMDEEKPQLETAGKSDIVFLTIDLLPYTLATEQSTIECLLCYSIRVFSVPKSPACHFVSLVK